MDDLAQFRQTYINECYELLQDMEERLLGLDSAGAGLEEINAIFRCAHSIKGGAGAFGFTAITRFTHILETLLDAMREGKQATTPEIVDMLLKSADIVTQMVRAQDGGAALPDDFGREMAEALMQFVDSGGGVEAVASQAASGVESAPTGWRISFKPHTGIFGEGNEPLLILRELAQLGRLETKIDTSKVPPLNEIDPDLCYVSWEIELPDAAPFAKVKEAFEFVEDSCDLVIDPIGTAVPEAAKEAPPPAAVAVAKPAGAPAPQTADAGAAAVATIRVDVVKIDRLVNMVGELVITQALLNAQGRDLPVDRYPELIKGIDDLSQHSRELQEAVMSVRMQPLKSVFSRMPRIVRDLSGKLGKDIRIVTEGEQTEVDKTVIEQLADPLTHMIRNSVDHGIEMPDDRAAAGKPKLGTIWLRADSRGGRIIIEIEDDGNGINREKVLAKARERGLVGPDADLTPEEIEDLIFMPGFSTAAQVSDISGRGVGMDVVRRNIAALNGTVQVRTSPGKGSCFTVILPLTLAILDGMVVRSGEERYIIPTGSIIETLRPPPGSVKRIADGNDVISVRGEFIPLLYLYRCFHIPNTETDPAKALVVLVEDGREKMGIVVDELVGQQQVVIKSLEENSDPIAGIAGATILGDGQVSLILDVGNLDKAVQENATKVAA